MTDKELIEKLKSSPQAGLAAVVDRYTAYVMKIARTKLNGICSSEDIEEAVSDIFFKFYQTGQSNGFDIRSVRAYLSVIAGRHCTDVFRKHISSPDILPLEDAGEIPAQEPLSDNRTTLAAAVKKLGEPDTSIFIRKYFFGQKTKEIAEELHLNPKAVDKRVSRGLVKLRKILKEEA
ncbi:RNA polymerase sigma factor [Ruminococcus albus]|uniref:RNA polymerase sigma factor n=1 Tax=Ruminococcus albus TaxID=1264 RepID=UPI0004635B15|nr:sigma-70 family RNA polymerase sigma factor [Ruminococcus albus]